MCFIYVFIYMYTCTYTYLYVLYKLYVLYVHLFWLQRQTLQEECTSANTFRIMTLAVQTSLSVIVTRIFNRKQAFQPNIPRITHFGI